VTTPVLAGALLGLVAELRAAGLPCPTDRVETFLTGAPAGVYWAGRLSLCSDPDELALYDRVFAAWIAPRPGRRAAPPPVVVRTGVFFGDEHTGAAGDDAPPARIARASEQELLRGRDLAGLSAAERAEVGRLIALLRPCAPTRTGRRRQVARRGPIDARRTARRLLAAGGEPALPVRHAPRPRPRRLVLLIDVSGSMDPYADALLRFGHAAVRRRPAATEVFTLGTRLTRVTAALRARDPQVALRLATAAVPDWSGGTRLGEALRAFVDRWGQRGTARRAVVVVFSDGWERGGPALLGAQMARLSRLAHRVVWVNPHRGRPGYLPVTAGMAAALPYVDDLVAGHSLRSLTELVEVIARA
jgi:uncharacterized protein with von Willebrand factor type A (vWA) domain